jgi:hypothetical protein
MKRLVLIVLIGGMIFLWGGGKTIMAQEVDLGEKEEPEQVIKLEELIIELEPIKVFTIPRMEADLPPIDFLGRFRTGFLKPEQSIFKLREEDLKPVKVKDVQKMLAKERK